MPIEFSRHAQSRFSHDFKARILNVYGLFPELQDKKIICGFISKRRKCRIEGEATSWTSPPVFRLRPNVSNYTIAHELTHLVQGKNGGSQIPHGEISCDIWTVDRLPVELLDQRPYYLMRNCYKLDWKENRTKVKALCRQAIEVRKTRRAYIVWLKHQIGGLDR